MGTQALLSLRVAVCLCTLLYGGLLFFADIETRPGIWSKGELEPEIAE